MEDIVNGDGSEEAKVEGKKLSPSALRGSFNALMSMDLQSVENLVELASSSNLASLLTESRSSAQMETFIQSLSSSGNLLKAGKNDSQAFLYSSSTGAIAGIIIFFHSSPQFCSFSNRCQHKSSSC